MRSVQPDPGITVIAGIDSSIRGLRRRATFASVPLAALLALLILASLQGARERPVARWLDHLHEAEAAMRAGDIYSARSLYTQTARIASWSDDWTGVLAAACGLKRSEKQRNDYFATRTALVRAMIAAENQRSAQGLYAVADAFSAIGEHNAAAMVRGRISSGGLEGAAQNSPLGNCP